MRLTTISRLLARPAAVSRLTIVAAVGGSLALAAIGGASARAETDPAKPDAAKAEAPKIALELNKLEATEKGCRVYMVTTNGNAVSYPTYQLDLVLFQPDGVIAKRIGMDIGPVKASKRSLKLFDLDGLPCDRIGSLLVNDVLECKSEAGALTQGACLAGLTLTALGNVKISK